MIWKSTCNNELYHYASPYYDPVKAHEYYMRTRELKGKQKKAVALNEKGQIAKKLVREALAKERQEKVNRSASDRSTSIKSSAERAADDIKADSEKNKATREAAKKSIVQHVEKGKKEIERLASVLQKGNLDANGKAGIKREIEKLREKNAKAKMQLMAAYNRNSQKLNEQHQLYSETRKGEHKVNSEHYQKRHRDNVELAKKDYERKLEAETERIENEPEFVKKKKK